MLWFLLGIIGLLFWAYSQKPSEAAEMSDDDRRVMERAKSLQQRDQADRWAYGHKNIEMTCPHCHVKGEVRTRGARVKKGISGGKATGAILTGGVSLLATGLSRKEAATAAHCCNCNNSWMF